MVLLSSSPPSPSFALTCFSLLSLLLSGPFSSLHEELMADTQTLAAVLCRQRGHRAAGRNSEAAVSLSARSLCNAHSPAASSLWRATGQLPQTVWPRQNKGNEPWSNAHAKVSQHEKQIRFKTRPLTCAIIFCCIYFTLFMRFTFVPSTKCLFDSKEMAADVAG